MMSLKRGAGDYDLTGSTGFVNRFCANRRKCANMRPRSHSTCRWYYSVAHAHKPYSRPLLRHPRYLAFNRTWHRNSRPFLPSSPRRRGPMRPSRSHRHLSEEKLVEQKEIGVLDRHMGPRLRGDDDGGAGACTTRYASASRSSRSVIIQSSAGCSRPSAFKRRAILSAV